MKKIIALLLSCTFVFSSVFNVFAIEQVEPRALYYPCESGNCNGMAVQELYRTNFHFEYEHRTCAHYSHGYDLYLVYGNQYRVHCRSCGWTSEYYYVKTHTVYGECQGY